MEIDISFMVNDEPYYVVNISKGADGINQFFEFHLTIRHEDVTKLKTVSLHHEAILLIGDLTYECEIVAKKTILITPTVQGGESGQQINLELRPKGWSTLEHKVVRVFEVSDEIENSVNLSFPAVPSLDDINRILNVAAFDEETDWIDSTANTPLYAFKLDWWQNQLAVQIQESNAELFRRLVWKMEASFLYRANQSEHQWLTIPDLCPVPDDKIVLTENQISMLVIDERIVNRYARWYQDELNQVNHLNDVNNTVVINKANVSVTYHQVTLQTHIPLACDLVYQYQPERRDHEDIVFMPLQINHSYDHRTGYFCDCTGQRRLSDSYFDLSVLDQPPKPFLTPLLATVFSESGSTTGDRDSKMRFHVRFDFRHNVNDLPEYPTAWLYRVRPNSSFNGAGDYEAIPAGTKVTVQMLNGDREQPVITGTLLTKHRGSLV